MGKKALASFGVSAGVLFLSSFVISGTYAGSSVVDEFTITIPESCSLTGTVGTAHTAEIENGVYTENVGETTIKAFCNDVNGFSVYTVGFTNDEYGNNTMKPATLDNTNAITTGLATSGADSNWAMKLTSLSDDYTLANDFGSYHAVPDEFTKVATYPSNTTTAAGVEIKSTYAAYISGTQPADSYTSKVKYIVLHPSSRIPTTDITDMTYMQDFKGLTSDELATVAISMQDNTAYNLIDNRDNKTYQIAKLKDGNIWMAENLDLGRTELTEDLTSDNTNLETTIPAETFNSWKSDSFSYEFSTFKFKTLDGTDPDSHTQYGTIYNYAVASAGTIIESNVAKNATYDICPAGWKITSGEKHSNEIKNLYMKYSYNTDRKMILPIEDGGAAFTRAGYYSGSYPSAQTYTGFYWTSSHVDGYLFMATTVSDYGGSDSSMPRYYGLSIRCIVKRPLHSLTITYGEDISSIAINNNIVQNGETITLEEYTTYPILATLASTENYGFSSWIASSGTLARDDTEFSTYAIGNSDAMLSASTSYVSTEMQSIAQKDCGTSIMRLKDSRDNHVYKVQRLADGNCWMVENLDLGRTELTTDLTSANTNIQNSIPASTFNSWKSTSGTNSYDTGTFIPVDGFDAFAGAPYGTLYNYYVASAGTISGETNADNAEYDICPAGWRLPTGGSGGEFNALGNAYGFAILYSHVDGGISFSSPGYFSNGAPESTDAYGYYWSSTVASDTKMHNLYTYKSSYGGGSMGYTNSSERYYGGPIRCVLQRHPHALTVVYGEGVAEVKINGIAIQNGGVFNAEEETTYSISMSLQPGYTPNWSSTSGIISSSSERYSTITINDDDTILNAGTTYVSTAMQSATQSDCTNEASKIRDSRDGSVYTIKRLADGNCWMIDNLNLGHTDLTADLTNENTNISSTIESSTFNSWRTSSFGDTNSFEDGKFYSITESNSNDGLEIDPISLSSYGTSYNYYAATAGTRSRYGVGGDAYLDICPAGWRLPTGGENGEYSTLYNNPAYNSWEKMTAPIKEGGAAFALAGKSGYNYTIQGKIGAYWSSTEQSYASAYYLDLYKYNLSVSPATTLGYYNCGMTVRCILKKPLRTLSISYGTGISKVEFNGITISNGGMITIEEGMPYHISATPSSGYGFSSWLASSGDILATTDQATKYIIGNSNATLTATASSVNIEMQNVSQNDCTTSVSQARDIRDNHVYTIQRLADGNCWMMDNLDLGRTDLDVDLTSANTNLATTISASTFNNWKNASTNPSFTTSTGVFVPVTSANSHKKLNADSVSGNPYGTLYNYYAASAGTISDDSKGKNAEYDICPAGWRLPTGKNFGEFYMLYNNPVYNSVLGIRSSIADGGAAFPLAGYFSDYEMLTGYDGYYWSSSSYGAESSNMDLFQSSVSSVYWSYSKSRAYGASIRCLLKKPIRSLTITYGTGISEIKVDGQVVQNGNTITFEAGTTHSIGATIDSSDGYAFSAWTASSGNIGNNSAQYSSYTIGNSNATLSASTIVISTEMQNLSQNDCSSTASKVKDVRDNHIYTIQRLPDGKCWMIDNLDLGRNTLTTDLTSINTNLSTTIPASTFNDWKKTMATSTYDSGEFISVEGSDATTLGVYGTLYNYYAASAGTISGSNNNSNASYDICPAGWRLPTNSSSGDYQTLYDYYQGSPQMHASIMDGGAAFSFAGYFYNSPAVGMDSVGYYWSSTKYNSANMGVLMLYSSIQDRYPPPQYSYITRNYGASIRCILK